MVLSKTSPEHSSTPKVLDIWSYWSSLKHPLRHLVHDFLEKVIYYWQSNHNTIVGPIKHDSIFNVLIQAKSVNKCCGLFEPKDILKVWTFLTGPDIKDHLTWTRCLHGLFEKNRTEQKTASSLVV